MKRRDWVLIVLIVGILSTVLYFTYRMHQHGAREVGGVRSKVSVEARRTYATTDCPHTFISWNIANFGKSHSDSEVEKMALILAPADIVAVQEVTARKGFGAQAVARLADALSRTGSSWDYIVSDPTNSPSGSVERYAFLWKKHVVSANRDTARLIAELEQSVNREPFSLLVSPTNAIPILLFTIHAVPTAKNPIVEVRTFAESQALRNVERAIVAGDFNLPSSKTNPIFASSGFTGHIAEKTSLGRATLNSKYLSQEYDNILTKGMHVCTSGVVDFVAEYFSPVSDESLEMARKLSDHLPVFATFR